MMNRFWNKLITFVLVVALVTTTASSAFAVQAGPQSPNSYNIATDTKNGRNDVAPAKDIGPLSQPSIIQEDISKRTKYSKEFIRSDASHEMVLYPEAVHYQKDGEWQDIDNTLISSKDNADSDVLENTSSDIKIKLPKVFAQGKPVSITKDEYILQFTLDGDYTGANGVVKSADKSISASMTDNEKKIFPTKLRSEVNYTDILPNIDIKYIVEPGQLKESLVVKSLPDSPLEYTYTVVADKLSPVLQKDNSINFYPDGETDGDPVFVMPAPYMVDAAGDLSYDVKIELNNDSGKYSITYSPSMEWMKDSNRAWPVTIDPQVIADLNINNIKDQQVDSNKGDVSYTSSYIECGRHTTYGKERIFMMYANLPTLTSADVIIDASIQIYRPYNSTLTSQMEVHKVNSTWDVTNLQWSNQPGYDASIDDYKLVKDSGWYTWSITDIARGWYAGNNTGMMFKLPDAVENGSTSNNKTFYSSDNGTGYRPILTIIYRNTCGLENYWNFHTQNVGRAGTGNVNDYTGNLVFVHNDIGFSGNIMPVSISHVYNADLKTLTDYGCGYGWRTNYNQKVYQWSVDTTYYVWEDDDGTSHYFKYSSANTYVDEDGLFLTLKNNETGSYLYSITDIQGNKKYFDSRGRLARIQNNQSTVSYIDITYVDSTSPKILTITDGVGRVYAFAYSGAYLSHIDYKGTGSTVLQSIGYSYNGSNELTTITHPDTRTTTYAYTTNHLLNRATDIDGYYVSYGYNTTSSTQPNRISSIDYYDNAVAGDTLSIVYAQNQTTFTDYQGRVTVEQFNNMGNTTCIQDDQGDAQYASYAKNGDGDSGTANQLTLSSKLQNTVTNYLKNSGGEYTDGWALVTSGSPGGSWSYSTDSTNHRIYIGTHSIKMTRTDEAGSYKLSQTMTLTKGKTYTLSAWVKTEGMSNTGNGTYLAIENSGNQVKSEVIKTTTSASDPVTDANGWRRIEVAYALPSGASSDSISFCIYQGTVGSAYYDCIQAEEAPTASRFNLVENSDFAYQGATSSDGLYWLETNTTTTDGRTTLSPSGCVRLNTNCFIINGDANTQKNVHQNVYISGSAGDVFSVSGWAKADSVPIMGTRIFALIAQLYHADGTYDSARVTYNPCSNSWQFGSGRLVATQAYTRIDVFACYYGEVNTAYFDGIQVFREEFGTGYTYDSNGNITNVGSINNDGTKNNSNVAIAYTNNNPTSITDQMNNVTSCGFDGNHNETSTITPNTEDTTTYDTKGNVTAEKTVDPDNLTGPSVETNTSYTTDGNYATTTTDESRHVTTYNYDSQFGTLQWLQMPNDTTSTQTAYSYNSINRMTGSNKPVANLYNNVAQMQNAFTYEDDSIKTISHNTTSSTNDTTFTFNYGDMRTLSNVQVGSGTPRTLVSNTYDSSNRSYNITKVTYGNSQWVQYAYDNNDRITGIQFNNDSNGRFSLMYNNAGNIGNLTDNSNNLLTKYIYDMGDNLQSIYETGINGRTYSHFYTWGFDANRNVTSFLERLNGSSWTMGYTFDGDNRLTSINYNYGARAGYLSLTYDGYNRISTRNVSDNGTQIFDTLYTFINPDSTHTSSFINTVENRRHSGGGYDKTLTYQYDSNSNIISIGDGTSTTTYSYDSANQLVRENNQAAGNTWTWIYDAGGNIREKREYTYTTDIDLTGKTYSAITYGYTDPNGWGDLMTSYNGSTISYDGLGNPTNDGTWTYTWEGGDNLVGLSKTGTTASYTYNKDGIRTSKTVNGVTTTYTLADGKVTQQTDGTNNIYFRYDNKNNLISMNLNGTEYYYLRNSQGDVAGLFDKDGIVQVEYTYDAWGKILSTTGSLAGTVGVLNPYRYRGYRYDVESGLYYLQSRYYNPTWGRFINSDDISTIFVQANLFTYCRNNPVMYSDPSGYFITPANVIGALIGLIGGAVIGAAIANYFHLGWPWNGLVIALTSALLTVVGWFAGPAIYAVVKPLVVRAIAACTLFLDKAQEWILRTLGIAQTWINQALRLINEASIRFSVRAMQVFNDPARTVPIKDLLNCIRNGTARPDAQGSTAIMYTLQNVLINGKRYKLEVLFNWATKQIWHFKYWR